MTWKKLHTTWRNQGSRHTRILGHLFKYGILVQFKADSRERFAILPNTVTCSRSLQHTTRSSHWKSGMYENSGGALPKSSLNSKIATGCTQTECAQRSTRPTMPRRKTILGPMKWIEELRGNLEQRRWLQNSWHTTFDIQTAEYKSQRQGQEFDRKLREPPAQGILPSGLKSDPEDQQVQQRIAGFDHRHEQHRDLRTLQKLLQTAMSWVQCLLEKGYQYFAVVEDA